MCVCVRVAGKFWNSGEMRPPILKGIFGVKIEKFTSFEIVLYV